MHRNILKPEQVKLLPLLKLFNKDFFLVGGTAIALHIGHRYSIDFDLFSHKSIKRKSIKSVLEKNNYHIQHILFEDTIQLHCTINNVKVTFFEFPYKIGTSLNFDKIINIPDLLTLAAMKAFALGGRGKWKDYVDMYFIFKNHFSFKQVVERADTLFKNAFSEKLFRQQLTYFMDISFEEEVEFLDGFDVSEQEVKNFLIDIATEPF